MIGALFWQKHEYKESEEGKKSGGGLQSWETLRNVSEICTELWRRKIIFVINYGKMSEAVSARKMIVDP